MPDFFKSVTMKKIFPWIIPVLFAGFFIGQYFYKQPKFINGETIPDFALNDREMLSDLKGKYLLIDFWGSWCGPCIAAFEPLKLLYKNFNGQQFTDADGFEIIGVAVEDDANRWKRAIEKYELNWRYQVLDLSTSLRFFNGKIATQYGVKELPTNYLINPDGVIVGVNLSIEEIEQRLQAKLTK